MQIPFPIIFNRYGFRFDTFSNVLRFLFFFFFFFSTATTITTSSNIPFHRRCHEG